MLSPEQVRAKYLLNLGGVTNLNHTFDTMRRVKGFENVVQRFTELATLKVTWYMLLVFGGSGNGKSRCCEAFVMELYDKGIKARRDRWADIIRFTLKEAMNNHKPDALTYGQVFRKLQERPVLIIDDVGMGSTGGTWEWGELEDIVDYRLEHKLLTIITTNLDQKDIPPRIISRFTDPARCKLVHNKAADQRPFEEQG